MKVAVWALVVIILAAVLIGAGISYQINVGKWKTGAYLGRDNNNNNTNGNGGTAS
jgi:hypothetical protein